MPGALLVADEDVPQLGRVEEWVVQRQDRATGDAERNLRARAFEREHQSLRAGYLLTHVVLSICLRVEQVRYLCLRRDLHTQSLPSGNKKPLVPGSTEGQRADVTEWSAGALFYDKQDLHASKIVLRIDRCQPDQEPPGRQESLEYKDFLLLSPRRLPSCESLDAQGSVRY